MIRARVPTTIWAAAAVIATLIGVYSLFSAVGATVMIGVLPWLFPLIVLGGTWAAALYVPVVLLAALIAFRLGARVPLRQITRAELPRAATAAGLFVLAGLLANLGTVFLS